METGEEEAVLRSVYYEHLASMPAFLVNTGAGSLVWIATKSFHEKFRDFQRERRRLSATGAPGGAAAIAAALEGQRARHVGPLRRVLRIVTSRPGCFVAGMILKGLLRK